MYQLANADTPLDALAPQDEAWTCLLHLEIQVQLTQASLIHHMTKLFTLCQITNHISQSLQALLEHLLPITALPTMAEPSPAASVVPPVALAASAGPQVQIPHLALSDALKHAITFKPVLLFLDDNSLFYVEADSSDFAFGAVLSQQSRDDGK
ncbi:hypothetical protein C0993_011085 [Termitomyces sp. T159_Od127]|nr:hypothetical protein C0993_011085 [Termitomyces sp. T159_Od127]